MVILVQSVYQALLEMEFGIVLHFELMLLPILWLLNFSYLIFLVFRFFVLEELDEANELVGEMSASEKPKN